MAGLTKEQRRDKDARKLGQDVAGLNEDQRKELGHLTGKEESIRLENEAMKRYTDAGYTVKSMPEKGQLHPGRMSPNFQDAEAALKYHSEGLSKAIKDITQNLPTDGIIVIVDEAGEICLKNHRMKYSRIN